jgi:hypothetical protein
MGLVYNHLATLVVAVFASVLTLLWPMFVDYAAVLDVVFLLAVPITWFLAAVCFVAQISADYMHGHEPTQKSIKKSVYTADGNLSG